MKKLISLLLCFALVLGLCGCNIVSPLKDISKTFFSVIGFDNTSVAVLKAREVKRGTSPLCYDKLSSSQKEIYGILHTAAEELTTGWIDVGQKTEDTERDILIAFSALTDDHPEIFWLPLEYFISEKKEFFTSRAVVAFEHTSGNKSCNYLFNTEEIPEKKRLLEERVDELLKKAEVTDNLFEKEVILHDELLNSLVYNETDDNVIYTSFGALVNGEAVCEGYARALQLLFNRIDLPNTVIHGEAENELHIWNAVKFNENWYYLDATWNDGENLITHKYFNVTDDLLKSHTLSPMAADYDKDSEGSLNFHKVSCTTDEFNFYKCNSLLLEEDYELASEAIKRASLSGEKEIELMIPDTDFSAKFSADYQKYCNELQKKLYLKRVKGVSLDSIRISENIVFLNWK